MANKQQTPATFKNVAAQGELKLIRVDGIPPGYSIARPDPSGVHIVAHSETGHHHVVDADANTEYYTPDEDMDAEGKLRAFLVVKDIVGKQLTHLRSFDTHRPLLIPPGVFMLVTAREYSPEGWRKVAD